jgi:hypothetical protein
MLHRLTKENGAFPRFSKPYQNLHATLLRHAQPQMFSACSAKIATPLNEEDGLFCPIESRAEAYAENADFGAERMANIRECAQRQSDTEVATQNAQQARTHGRRNGRNCGKSIPQPRRAECRSGRPREALVFASIFKPCRIAGCISSPRRRQELGAMGRNSGLRV